jgi:hypothetical protein
MAYKDKSIKREAHRKYMRERYKTDTNFRNDHKERVKRNNDKRREQVTALITDFRSKGCNICLEKEHCCLSAHHLDSTQKDFNIGDGVYRGLSVQRIKRELEKCVCLCENCHRKVHAGILTVS